MSGMELAWGYLMGHDGTLPPPSDPRVTPRAALELVVRRALQRPPCGVAFSGGRDSSLVLAIATHVARRDGLPDPVPITRVFPAIVEADEQEFQETVVRHLGLHDWHRVVFEDELDVVDLSLLATSSLTESSGPRTSPPMCHSSMPSLGARCSTERGATTCSASRHTESAS